MGEDYNAVIEDFRSRGKSDEYIANVLMYDPKYKLDPNKARALLNLDSKKKEQGGNPFTISSSISSDIVLASPSELTERTQNPVSEALSPSIKEEDLSPQIKQWRNYNISEGLHSEVNMYDTEDMQSAYVTDAVDWSLENNVFDGELTREDILGGNDQKDITAEQTKNIRSAMSAYDDHLKSQGDIDITEKQISKREMDAKSLSIIKTYSKKMEEDYKSTHKTLMSQNEEYRKAIEEAEEKFKKGELTERGYRTATNRAFQIHAEDYWKERFNEYTEEIVNSLPEDLRDDGSFLEDLSEDIYEKSNRSLRLDLDGDNVYNEGIPILSQIGDLLLGTTATAVDILGPSVAALQGGGFASASQTRRLVYDAQKELSEYLRSNITDYQDYEYFSLDEDEGLFNHIAHGLGDVTRATGQVLPYAAIARGGYIGIGILGVTGAVNTFSESYYSDVDRVAEGLDPVFDPDSSLDNTSRLGMSVGVGAIQAYGGKILGGIAGRAVGQAGSGALTNSIVRGLMGGAGKVATKTRALKAYLLAQGIDAVGEGIEEVVENAVQTAFESGLGDSDVTWNEFVSETQYAFAEGIKGSAGIGGGGLALGRGARSGNVILNGDVSLITGPQAATNSVADPSSSEVEVDGESPLIQGKDKESYEKSSGEIEKHRRENEKRYRVIKLRYPEAFDKIARMDAMLASKANKAGAIFSKYGEGDAVSEEDQAALTQIEKEFKQLIEQRAKLYNSFKDESLELTNQEARNVDKARINRKVKDIDDEVRLLEESLAEQDELLGTTAADPDVRNQIESDLERAKAKRERVQELSNEVDRATAEVESAADQMGGESTDASAAEMKAAEEAKAVAEQELLNYLGVKGEGLGLSTEKADDQKAPVSRKGQVESHSKNGGSTFSLDGKDMSGQPKASVSIFPERTKLVEGESVTEEDIDSFVEENKDLFEGNEDVLTVGTWYDSESGKTYIDVITVTDKESAVELGRQYNQKAVWDLEFSKEIDTEGTGEAQEGAKPEAERVADIRSIIGKEVEAEAEAEAEAKDQAPEQTTEEAPKETEERGIVGQFTDHIPSKDGTFGVIPKGSLSIGMARFLNGKVVRTVSNMIADGRPIKIRIHDTVESANKAWGKGLKEREGVRGFKATEENGEIVIHVNPQYIAETSENSTKAFEAVILEELQHGMLGPTINTLFKTDRKAADKLLSDLMALAPKEVREIAEQKIKAYREYYKRETKKSDDEIEMIAHEEAVFEITSRLAPMLNGMEVKAKKKLLDKIRVIFNQMYKAINAPKQFTITDVTNAEQLVQAMALMSRYGTGIKLSADGKVESGTESDRASIKGKRPVRVVSLPEDGKFTVSYNMPSYGRGATDGIMVGSRVQEQEFNGKWHFVNWWKRATKMGQLPYGSWEIDLGNGPQPFDADAMKKWNMSPPKRRKTYSEQRREERDALFDESNAIKDLLINEFGRLHNPMQKKLKSVTTELFGEELVKDVMRQSSDGKSINTLDLTVEQLSQIRLKIEEDFGLRKPEDGDQMSSDRASLDINKEAHKKGDPIQRAKTIGELAKKVSCGGVVFTCNISEAQMIRNDLMTQISKSVSGADRKPSSIAADILPLIQFHLGDRLSRTGKDIRTIDQEIKGVYDKVSDYMESVHGDILPENHRDHFGIFAAILAVTSNGATAESNLDIAIRIYDSYIYGISQGLSPSEAVSKTVLDGIEAANPEIIVNKGDINKQRAGAIRASLERVFADADRYYKDGKFNSEAMAKRYARKKTNKNAIQSRFIIGTSDAAKTGEHAAGMMGRGERAYLESERWVRRFMHVFQGKFIPLSGDTVIRPEAISAAESLAEEAGVTDQEINNILEEKYGVKEGDYGFTHRGARAVAAMKAIRARGKGKFYKRASKATWTLLGRDSIFDDGGSNLEVNDALSRKTMEELVKMLNRTTGRGEPKWNAYSLQQSIWEIMQEEMGAYRDGEYALVSYGDLIESAIERVSEEGLGSVNMEIEMGEGDVIKGINNSGDLSSDRASMLFDPIDLGPGKDVVNSNESPLYRARSIEEVGMVKVGPDNYRPMTDRMVSEALKTDKRSVQIMNERNEIEEGKKVAVRLNLNVKKNTGVPVQTVHDKSATGKALRYSGAVTLNNVELAVNQGAREKIVTFQENKFPMAAVQGEFVSDGVSVSDLDGVKATFNPFREHLFVDASGRAIKSAEQATVIGNTVLLRGKITYFNMNDPILQRGKVESPKGKAKRLLRGDKYEQALKRFKSYAEGALGMEFKNRAELELAYDGMQVGSKVALAESEVADNMANAADRASISSYLDKQKMRQTARKQANTFLNTTRQAILDNPENYISPQNISKIKNQLQDVTDQELIEYLTDESIGRLSQKNDDIGVLAGSELIRRAVARGEMDRIPSIVAELAAVGTTAGRILRHFRELKSSGPAGLAAIIESAVSNNGNSLSEQQKIELQKITSDLFGQQAKVEDLMRRAVGGEEVDAELKEAVEAMKNTERKLDTFANNYIEKDWGSLFGQLVQGNLLTTMSQVFNVAANMVNAAGHIAVDLFSLPFEAAMTKIGTAMGKDIQPRRRPSLMAYVYGVRKFGLGFVEAADQVVTGQDQELSEWRVSRGLAPFRSLKAAFQKDLPLGPDGQGSLGQRRKLFVQGTLGIPAEAMFRLLSLGDIPFRRFAEGIDLYQTGKAMGLEGESLKRFLKYPTRKELERAKREGRKLTFQEETAASKNVNSIVSALEGIVARGVEPLGINGDSFAKALFKVILPFRSTPANILYETFTWVNPYVGTVRMASELKRGDVEESSKTLAKMMIGSVTMEAAIMLISEGIISGPVQWDEDEEKNMAYDIFPPSSVNVSALRRLMEGGDTAHQVDDYFIRYDKLGMIGAIMSTAVQSVDAESIKERNYSSPVQFAAHTISDFFGAGSMSAISAMMEQSFVQGLNGFLKVLMGDNVERDLENFLTTMFKAGSAAFLPNQLNAFYRAERDYLPDSRVTKDVGEEGGVMGLAERLSQKFLYTIKDRTFGLADYPVRINWKGEEIQQTPRGASGIGYQLFDVTKSRQGSADPLSNEVWRLYEQTEDLTSVCGTPSYASTRKLSVPNITSKKDIRMVKALGRGYTWIDDEEFMAERIYLSTRQINELMKVSGRARYEAAMNLVETKEYKEANDQEKVEMLNEVADDFNSAKEYGPNGYRRHTVLLFDMIQKIYDAR